MKRTFLNLMIVFLSITGSAQINWLYDFKMAKGVAQLNSKLIVIDFWADWCVPCKTMNDNLWNLPEMKEISQNFVPLKINIDFDPGVTSTYGVKGIPMVVITTITGEVIWSNVGFRFVNDYLPVFKSIPADVGNLNDALILAEKKSKDPDVLFQLGLEYQQIGKKIESIILKSSILNKSNQAFNKSKKASSNDISASKAELYSLLNDAYLGKQNSVLKKMEKAEAGINNNELSELKHFILAYCFKLDGNLDNYKTEKEQVINNDLLTELENLK